VTPSNADFSQRAVEVSRDLFDGLRATYDMGVLTRATYHLDGSAIMLSYEEARRWIQESVDAGFPEVRQYVEREPPDLVINLAAFEDPDSQYHE
jgi:dTDP-4-dehydrorhamnose reductase